MITSLLKVVNRLAASCEMHAGLMQVKLFHQLAASLQMSSCSKSDVHSYSQFTIDEVNRLEVNNLLANCISPVKHASSLWGFWCVAIGLRSFLIFFK